MDAVEIAIVVLNFNGALQTIRCLQSLRELMYSNYNIVVVDNGSTDGSFDVIRQWVLGEGYALDSYKLCGNSDCGQKKVFFDVIDYSNDVMLNNVKKQLNITIIRTGCNSGYASGNNIGIQFIQQKIRYSYIWILNNDIVADHSALNFLVDYVMTDSNIGICGSKIIELKNNSIQTVGGHYNNIFGLYTSIHDVSKINSIDVVPGASMLLSRQCIENVGYFPEEYFLYYEDIDYCLHAKAYGYRIGVAVESVIYHATASSSGGSSSLKQRNRFIDFLCLRNRMVCANKYITFKYLLYCGMIYSGLKRLYYGDGRAFRTVFGLLYASISGGNEKLLKEYSVNRLRNL